MAADSCNSSGICTENEVKDHVYQIITTPGPRGSYEARQVNNGFYVRVDMPGVPPDDVKLFKCGDTRTVTFSGKAPRQWPDCESFDRVYGGYVVLNRNPNDIDVEMSVVNGSLKLFFPNADGVLHFIARKKPVPLKHLGDEIDCCHNKLAQFVATQDEEFLSVNPALRDMEMHPSGCNCCKDGNVIEYEDLKYNMDDTHINPYLLAGVIGVKTCGRVDDATGERLCMRIDMPGVGEKNMSVKLENSVNLVCKGEGSLEHPFDEGGRTYAVGLMMWCTCCKIVDVKHAIRHGVLRVSVRRRTIPSSSEEDCKYTIYSL